jgi:hypothetical protein
MTNETTHPSPYIQPLSFTRATVRHKITGKGVALSCMRRAREVALASCHTTDRARRDLSVISGLKGSGRLGRIRKAKG